MNDHTIIADRKALLSQAEAIASNPQATKADLKRADVLIAQAAELRTDAEILSRLNATAEEVGLPTKVFRTPAQHEKDDAELRRFIATGQMTKERRGTAMNIGTGSQGGFLVPQDFYFAESMSMAMSQYDAVFDDKSVTRITRDTARPMQVPGIDFLAVTASIVNESALVSPSTLPTVLQTNLSAPSYSFRSLWVPVSMELLQDSAYDVVEKVLVPAFSLALAKGAGPYLVTGTGSGQPAGILTGAASSGVTTASPTAITATELETVYLSLDRAYRASPNCKWLMNDATYLMVRKLTDTTNLRPLIDITQDGERLFGKPIVISPSMPAATATLKPILLGDLSQFYVTTTGLQLFVKAERNAEFGQTVVSAGMRVDSKVVASGASKPVVYLTMHV
jgi:HK97 family phage major capsid protein